MSMKGAQRIFALLCVLALVLSTLPLYAIALYNHPYYDDYGFSATVHQAWKDTGDLGAVLDAALVASAHTRQTWQGTYTGTLLTNLQPGLFSESLYWVGNWLILTALIVCVGFFLQTAFAYLGLERWARVSLVSLALLLIIQFIPDVGEAFFWFNGGIGNTFIYSLIALASALCIRLYHHRGPGVWLTAALAALAVVLGGGSYGGGLFVLCLSAVALVWLFARRHGRRWRFLALAALFAACFAYNMSAPGNSVRAGYINYQSSFVKTVLQAMYFGIAQMGQYLRLPLVAVTLPLLPALAEAAQKSGLRFEHPWLALGLGTCLYCTQFAPPLYAIASIGDGRIVNTYFISFVLMWFLYAYYLAGFAASRVKLPALTMRQTGSLALTSLCLFGIGCLGFRHSDEELYGAQNLSGASSLISMVTGEAQQYDREMDQREALLNDESQPVVTLKPLSCVPSVFMEDLLRPDSGVEVESALRLYYGKEDIHIAGEEEAP